MTDFEFSSSRPVLKASHHFDFDFYRIIRCAINISRGMVKVGSEAPEGGHPERRRRGALDDEIDSGSSGVRDGGHDGVVGLP